MAPLHGRVPLDCGAVKADDHPHHLRLVRAIPRVLALNPAYPPLGRRAPWTPTRAWKYWSSARTTAWDNLAR